MNTSNANSEKIEKEQPSSSSEFQASTSSTPPKYSTKVRQTGNSDFFTTSYVKLTKENVERTKLNNDAPKKYYFFDEKEKLKSFQLLDPAVIENLQKTEQDFTAEEGLLFNDPTMAKLAGRTKEECIEIFTKIVNNPAVFNALQNSLCDMNSDQMHKLMYSLPFTELEDIAVKRLDSKLPPSDEQLHDLQKNAFIHFRGRKAIESRYFELWSNKELDEQKFNNFTLMKENTILPFHDEVCASHLKYLTACSTPELNDTLNFVNNVSALSRLQSSNDSHVFGKITIRGKVYEICNEKSFVYFSSGKLDFQPTPERYVSYCSNICIKISDGQISFLNAFGVAVIINGLCILSGHKSVFPHKGTFVIDIPKYGTFYYTTILPNASENIKKAFVKPVEHNVTADGEIITEKIDQAFEFLPQTISTDKIETSSEFLTVPKDNMNPEVNGKTQPISSLPSSSAEKRVHDNGIDKIEPDAKRIHLDENAAKADGDAQSDPPVAYTNISKIPVERKEIVKALHDFTYPSDEFDSVPIPFDLRAKATMRSIKGLPTTRPSDSNLLPEFVLYKYLTLNAAKSELPCDYLAFQRYLKDEMAEKLKLSKFIIPKSIDLSRVQMSDKVNGAVLYNKKVEPVLPLILGSPSKYESDIRFSTKKEHVIEDEKIEYYGQLRFKPPNLHESKKLKNFPPKAESDIYYKFFNCGYNVLNSYTPGVPKVFPYFRPKPKLVRNQFGHPVWINVPEKAKPQTQSPVKQYQGPPSSSTRPLRPEASTFKRIYSPNRPQFTLYSAPQYASLPSTPRLINDGHDFRIVAPVTSASETGLGTSFQGMHMDDGRGSGT
uniref:Uncharacterized protein n=1 Tax=Panagrolaimus sp. ES5 TaxID=591445 RepID=A0AC34F2X8_9BILA